MSYHLLTAFVSVQYHAWVNIDGMLDACRVGRLVGGASGAMLGATAASQLAAPTLQPRAPGPATLTLPQQHPLPPTLAQPVLPANAGVPTVAISTAALALPPAPVAPRVDWFQVNNRISLIIYAKQLAGPQSVSVHCEASSIQITVYGHGFIFERLIALAGTICPEETLVNVSPLCTTVTLIKTSTEVCCQRERCDSRGEHFWLTRTFG